MPTAAIASYGIQLRLGDGVSPGNLPISGATNATPIVITTIPHSIVVGEVQWVNISGVLGNTAANGSWIVQALSPTTLELRGSVGNGVYTSGGFALLRNTFTTVAELVNLTPIGVTFNMVDASAHDGNGWGTSIPTHKNGTDMRVELNSVPDDPTHDHLTGLLDMALTKARADFLIVLPDPEKSTVAFQGFVSDHGTQTPVDGVLRATPIISIDGQMVWNLG